MAQLADQLPASFDIEEASGKMQVKLKFCDSFRHRFIYFEKIDCPKEYRQHELDDRAGGILPGAPARVYLGKRSRYSPLTMNALTISACSKLPLNWFSLFSQNAKPLGSASRRR